VLDGCGHRHSNLAGQRPEGLAGARHDPGPNEHAIVAKLHGNGGAAEDPPPAGTASPDAGYAGHLECREVDELDDHASPDGQLRAAHDASLALADAAVFAASDSAINAGTWVRAVVAATSQAKPIMRRRARPWVMITVPRTPSNGEPPVRS